jgi:hypothetical protein
MDKEDWFVFGTWAIFVVLVVLLVVVYDHKDDEATEHYRATCAETGGKPAHNGWVWECLK